MAVVVVVREGEKEHFYGTNIYRPSDVVPTLEVSTTQRMRNTKTKQHFVTLWVDYQTTWEDQRLGITSIYIF